MPSSNCCLLTCIQLSQEADQVIWYSHLFHNFPQFIVIHTVKGFGIINKAEINKSGPITSWQIEKKQWKQCQTLFFGAPESLQMVIAAMKLKDAYSLEEKL